MGKYRKLCRLFGTLFLSFKTDVLRGRYYPSYRFAEFGSGSDDLDGAIFMA